MRLRVVQPIGTNGRGFFLLLSLVLKDLFARFGDILN